MADWVLPDLRSVLNPEQHRAATTTEGPLLVLAGAGSGKTRVLVHRIAHILAEKRAKPWQILAVTFTNKAASEMRTRLEALVGPAARDAWIGTFHALSARMLRIEGHRLGYPGSFSIYDADDARRLLRSILADMQIDPTGHGVNLQNVAAEIEKAKNRGLGPEAFAREVKDRDAPHRRVTKAVYFRYQDALRRSNAMDFGDLVRLATELLAHHPEAFERFGRRFRYVMVDEFQDTNRVQYAFLRELTREHRNLMAVGDDDQSIYRWRGAEIAHILGFDDEHPDAEVVTLEQNYRSTGNILAAANAVIAHNRSRHPKVLRTDAPAGGKVSVAAFADGSAEAEHVARLVAAAIDDGREASDHAVLFRMNAQSRLFEEAFRRARVPYRLVGGTGFYDRAEVKDVVAYLRLLVNPTSAGDFARIVNTPTRGIGQKTIERLRAAAFDRGLEGLRALELPDDALRGAGIGPSAVGKLRAFGRLMADLRALARNAPASEVAHAVIEATRYLEHLEKADPASADDRKANVGELISSIAEREATLDPAGDAGLGIAGAKTPLEAFLDEASLASGERSAGAPDGVQLMTLHAAKGLEFPVVIIAGLEDKTFPAARAVEDAGPGAMEEERRLCYVGMTRAMEALHLTLARRRVIFGKTEIRYPSRFLGELPDDLVEGYGAASSPPPRRRDPFEDHLSDDDLLDDRLTDEDALDHPLGRCDPSPFADPEGPVYRAEIDPDGPRPGGRATHATFGEGAIVGVEGTGRNARVAVQFADGRVRTVVARFLDFC